MKVLIVGCGAVGQVYGLFLQKAGVSLGYLDQPATVAKLKQRLEQGGMPLFQISHRHRRNPIPHWLENFQVVGDIAECIQFGPDQIWFATPSPVYYSNWFHEFLREVPCNRVVCFAPEGPRPEFFPEGSRDRLIFGGTTFMAWQGSLEGGGGQPEGVNFWRSPLGIPLVGAEKASHETAALLKKMGFRAMIGKPDSHLQASITAVMTAFVAGLELSGWSLKSFRWSLWLQRAAGASRETILGCNPGVNAFQRAFLGNPLLTTVFFLAAFFLPMLFPFDLEKYLKFHYLKTRDQSLTLLELFEKDGEGRGLPVENIRALLRGLRGSA